MTLDQVCPTIDNAGITLMAESSIIGRLIATHYREAPSLQIDRIGGARLPAPRADRGDRVAGNVASPGRTAGRTCHCQRGSDLRGRREQGNSTCW